VPDARKTGRRVRRHLVEPLSLASIPITLGVAPAIGWWLGRIIDRKIGTDWVFQALGVVLGIGAAVREIVLLIRRLPQDPGGPRDE
jgi:F0F1-type ATP synthase assembly protein I